MLFLITNRKIMKYSFKEIIETVIDHVDVFILREKDLSDDELLPIGKYLRKITKEKNKLLMVNSNLYVAKEIDADGYHMSFKPFMEGKVDWKKTIGVSVHSVEEAILAEKNGATYILASHVFETDCKRGSTPRGINFIREIKEKVKIPVIALGGIVSENVEEVLSVGVDAVAVMSYIMASDDPHKSSKKMKKTMSYYFEKNNIYDKNNIDKMRKCW